MEGHKIELHDGRHLGFCEYGDPDGIPLMLFHGTPGSRLFRRLESAAWVQEFGMRVITPERPGFGLSDPAPGRTISDWANDVEELADHLCLDRYHVAGGSGGGPYALACAIQSAERVLSATLFCSAGPPEVMPISRDMDFGNRLVFFGARYAPFVLRLLLAHYVRVITKHPEKFMAAMAEKMGESDRRMVKTGSGDATLEHVQEAFRQGADGTYRDMLLVGRSWHLDLEAITVPVYLWHGNDDTLAPASTGHGLAELIPGCEAHFIPEAGHGLFGNKKVAARMVGKMVAVRA